MDGRTGKNARQHENHDEEREFVCTCHKKILYALKEFPASMHTKFLFKRRKIFGA
ncbi:Uncharacterised protein [Enterobacter cloacae]|nr:Uncharacterised protein [Enterobacter cloacae]